MPVPSTSAVRRAPAAAGLLAALLVANFGHAAQSRSAQDADTTTPAQAAGCPRPAGVQALAQALVDESLANNAEMKGVQATVAQRVAALDAARAHYLPAIDFQMRYTRADGGRQIDLPVGDLLNPVYSTLNDLLQAAGKPAQFPQIKNESIPLLRPHEQDTSLRLTQPLFDMRVSAGVRGREAELRASNQEMQAFRSRLTRDVHQAYYRWLRARQSARILDVTVELAEANLKVNESLSRNGKITPDLVLRAEADLLEIQQAHLAVQNGVRLAQAYVNLLRNLPMDEPLPETDVCDADVEAARTRLLHDTGAAEFALPAMQGMAEKRRAELARLDAALDAAKAGEDLVRARLSPQLALAVDAGIQGENYDFGGDAPYMMASLVLRYNTFNGGGDIAALNEARAVTAQLRAARAQAVQGIGMEVLDALQVFDVAYVSLRTAEKRVAAVEGAFAIAEKKRDLGQINQTEFIDARRSLTDARLNRNMTRFAALSQLAELEYAVGGTIPTEEKP